MAIAFQNDTQNFSVVGQDAGKLVSHTFFECSLSTKNGDNIKLPVQYCTKVGELKEVLSAHLGYIDVSKLEFVVKQGPYLRKLYDSDRINHNIRVVGIDAFDVPRHKYPHPYGIIGAGYSGLKLGMTLQSLGSDDYVIWDRYPVVGGHTWLEMANKTTRLQTEFPTYHVWYGPEMSEKCGGPPTDLTKWPIWPKRDQVRDHLQYACKCNGMSVNCQLGVHVESVEMVGKITDMERYYEVACEPVNFQIRDNQGGGALSHQLGGDEKKHRYNGNKDPDRAPFQATCSCVAFFPGALVFPRPVHYKGEDLFGGSMDYAVEMRFDYSHVPDQAVTIIGHGAFTMENIRTCLEERAKYIYVLCRKVNLTCPRVVSWFVNQSNPYISAAQLLDMLEYSYKHTVCKDDRDGHIHPWEVHSVVSNKDRTHATIWSKTRFGIGDVYFLAQAYGLCEIIVSNVKRCTYHTLHLENGNKIETSVVLKCTGCLGDWKVDETMKIKEMIGLYVNGDVRRVCTGEPDGINASSFGGTTGGPGIYGQMKNICHWWDVPNDWNRLVAVGILQSMPSHKAGDPDEEFPAYFFSAAHALSAGIQLGGASPILGRKTASDDTYKNWVQLHCLPPDVFLRECLEDWHYYEKKIRDDGLVPQDAPYVPYPYSPECIAEQFEIHKGFLKKRFGVG